MSENENGTAQENQNQEGSENGTQELSPEELKAELKRVRQEAASRRIANRELEDKAKLWEQHQESQKTELQKLQDQIAERDKKLSAYEFDQKRLAVLKEFKLEEDDLDLLTGSDEETIRKQAEKLKAKNDKLRANNDSSRRPADLLAGPRGTPVGGGSATNSFDDIIRQMAGK